MLSFVENFEDVQWRFEDFPLPGIMVTPFKLWSNSGKNHQNSVEKCLGRSSHQEETLLKEIGHQR